MNFAQARGDEGAACRLIRLYRVPGAAQHEVLRC